MVRIKPVAILSLLLLCSPPLLAIESVHADLSQSMLKREIPSHISESKLFRAKTWQAPPVKITKKTPPPPPVIAAPPELPPEPPPMSTPALPFSFVGRLAEGTSLTLFLSKNGESLQAKLHDVLAGVWRLDKITATVAVFTYIPTQTQQTLPFNSNAIGSAAWQKLTPEVRE